MKTYSDMGYKWPLLISISASIIMIAGFKSPWYIDILFFIISVGLACVYVDTVRYTRGLNYNGGFKYYMEFMFIGIGVSWILLWVGLTSMLYIISELHFDKTDTGTVSTMIYSIINSLFISVSLCFGATHGE